MRSGPLTLLGRTGPSKDLTTGPAAPSVRNGAGPAARAMLLDNGDGAGDKERMSDEITEKGRKRAAACIRCPVCKRARKKQRGLCFFFFHLAF